MSPHVVNEFFVPEPGVTLDEYLARRLTTPVHHLIRYQWAEAVVDALDQPSPLLDVACGAGYGSYGIARRYPEVQVVGADYDQRAIAFAQRSYQRGNLLFVEGDVTRWSETLGDREYACIVSFDTIEHLEHREIAMQGIVDHLSPGGVLLLSTPVRGQNVLHPGWEHHKIEYARASLYDFLKRYFEVVQAADAGGLPCAEVFDRVNRDEEFYLLRMNPVVCSKPIRIELRH